MNIAASFGTLIGARIQPTESERLMVQQHLSTIKGIVSLQHSICDVFWSVGVFARGTFNRGGSDIDIFAVISRKDVTWGDNWIASTTALKNMREELLRRYPNTRIGTDVHAVVIPFSEGASVDVVPAVFDQMDGKRPRYFIPDGNGDWMPTQSRIT